MQALFAKRISSPRYVSAIRTEPVESTPQVATAAIGTVSVRRSTAVVRWTGNLAADTYDLAVRRAGAWRIVTGLRATSRRFRGRTRQVMRVRIRGETIDGVAGEWSGVRRVVFGR